LNFNFSNNNKESILNLHTSSKSIDIGNTLIQTNADNKTINENKSNDNNKNNNDNSNINNNSDNNTIMPIKSFGFESYSNINPFTTAFSAIANKTDPFAIASSSKNFSDLSKNKSNIIVETTNSNTSNTNEKKKSSLSELDIPSPKSPKVNPFASTSPSNNPFMKMVENKEIIWEKTTSTSSSTDGIAATTKDKIEEKESDNDDDDDAEKDDDTGNDPETEQTKASTVYKTYEMPENVITETGEENELCKLQLRGKLYRLNIDEINDSKKSVDWVEVGVGPIKILQTLEDDESQRTSRIVMRREGEKKSGQGTKLLLNALLKSYTSITKAGEKMFRLTCINAALEENTINATTTNSITDVINDTTSSHTNTNTTTTNNNTNIKTNPLTTYLIKTKLTQESDNLYDTIEEIINKSKI